MNLIRNLLGLIISVTMLPICIEVFMFASRVPFDYNEVNDEIALSELREQLLIAYDMNVSSDELNFIYKNKDFRLSLVNRKLLLQPGSQMFLNDIDSLYFDVRNGCIYVCYERNNKQYERIIGKQEGIYIDDFSACDVLLDEFNCSE